ncbi:hypothetical protein PInf_029977 [Phytophthora infestans]|nr:hypothetical protein PInf_029977 [Phytophthora infestans]
MASSDGGMSNADFARMFRKEVREEAQDHDLKTTQEDSSTDYISLDSNPMESAARRRRQEMAPTCSTQDADEMPRASGLDSDPIQGQIWHPRLGFRPSSGTGLGRGADTQDAVPSRPVKTKTYGWEKHTTGFGTKMLAKMGFKGRLGKKEDGVSATIEVKKRPTQMGMGYGDFVEASNLKQNRKLQKELKGETVEMMTQINRLEVL